MQKSISVIALVLFICAVIYGAFFLLSGKQSSNVFSSETDTSVPYVMQPLTQEYKNTDFNFSLMMPADFTPSVSDTDDGGKVVVLQNKDSNGIQITITPFDEDIQNLDEARIHQDVPDLKISDAQPIEIGDNDKGLAFKSDNQAFSGASREVWFVFRGNLYQISTYDRLDPLLKAIFATWKFF